MHPKILPDLLITIFTSLVCSHYRSISILVPSLDELKRWSRTAPLGPGNINVVRFLIIQSRLHALDETLIPQINLMLQFAPKALPPDTFLHKLLVTSSCNTPFLSKMRQQAAHLQPFRSTLRSHCGVVTAPGPATRLLNHSRSYRIKHHVT